MSTQPQPPAVPADSAGQSLTDALSTSFRILKLAMVILLVLFLASGTFIVDQNEQAIVLRLGERVGGVRDAGFNWAFPAPIDEVVKVPVKQSSTVTIRSHWMHLNDNELGIPLVQVRRGGKGLHPTRDGALLTGDKGFVHVLWEVTYIIDDLAKYVSLVSDTDVQHAEELITAVLEHAAIDVVGGYTTEDATVKRLSELRAEVKNKVDDELATLDTGIVVESVEIHKSTPPIQALVAFANVTREENNKRTRIGSAQQQATERLNAAAGASHTVVIAKLDALDAATDAAEVERLTGDIDRIIEFEASGRAGAMVRSAKGYYTTAVQGMRADAEQYNALLAEYRINPELLVARLWQEAKSALLRSPGLTKLYRPPGSQFRLKVGLDPGQRARQERDEYLREVQQGDPHQYEIKNPGGPLTVPD